jgi:hypothetical protein
MLDERAEGATCIQSTTQAATHTATNVWQSAIMCWGSSQSPSQLQAHADQPPAAAHACQPITVPCYDTACSRSSSGNAVAVVLIQWWLLHLSLVMPVLDLHLIRFAPRMTHRAAGNFQATSLRAPCQRSGQ